MKIQKLSCSNCGSGSLVKVSDPLSEISKDTYIYECSYCKTRYVIETDEKGSLKDLKISGHMQNMGTYAVHKLLKLSGNMNTVVFLRSSRRVTHVNTLKISGNMNSCSVILLDGAEIKNTGNMNTLG